MCVHFAITHQIVYLCFVCSFVCGSQVSWKDPLYPPQIITSRGGKCHLDHTALVYTQRTSLSSCLSKGSSTFSGVGCASLSYKPPGLQIYMCKNNPVGFCFGTETTWPENTIIPFFSDHDKRRVRVYSPRRRKKKRKETRKEREKQNLRSIFKFLVLQATERQGVSCPGWRVR